MKQLFTPLVLLFGLTLAVSCSKSDIAVEEDPAITNATANFEVVQGDDPFTFEFKNLSSKYKKLEWRFGDDTLSVAENPSHVYLTAGTFTVDLRAISETGAVSRMVRDIKIIPDSVLKVVGSKTTTANSLKFEVSTKAQIEKAEWKVVDVSRPASVTQTSNTLTPTFTLPVGVITPVTVKVTTKKGSTVTVTKSGSTEGVVTDFMTTLLSAVPSREGTNSNELSARLVDNADSKIYLGWAQGNTWTFTMTFAYPQAARLYAIGNGNDSPGRDPRTWTIEGSNDGVSWEILDSRDLARHFTDQLLDRGFKNTDADTDWKKFYFAIANPKAYSKYRFNLTRNFGDGGMQFGDIRFFK